MEWTLFNNENANQGFRLMSFEVYNWGTFDGIIHKIEPNGETTLLTGASGSGKTTLVDGLLTLLVPKGKLHYNQAQGAETKKGGRSEDSYFFGHIGKTDKIDMLRAEKNHYSVLLARFFDAALNQFVTIAQVRWYSSGQIQKEYITAQHELSIATDFNNIDLQRNWKKILKDKYPKLKFHDSFREYAERFRDGLGIVSEQGMSLFNKTVGLKLLDNLDKFIKENMLDAKTFEDETKDPYLILRKYFEELTSIHNAIEKSKKQIELLTPIVEKSIIYRNNLAHLQILKETKEIVPAYFAVKKDLRITELLADCVIDKKQIEDKLESLQQDIIAIDEQKVDLRKAIDNDKDNELIKEYKKQKTESENKYSEKSKEAEAYNKCVLKANLTEVADEIGFSSNIKKANQILNDLKLKKLQTENDWAEKIGEQKELSKKYENMKIEFEDLCKRKSNIPTSSLRIRDEIVQHLQVTESEIPFIGELIKVNEDSKETWEYAIEKLLHNFGLRLVVAEKYCHQVNEYVNNHNLRGRLIYNKVDKRFPPNILLENEPRLLINKLQFNSKSEYATWLENAIQRQYDYLCVENITQFNSAKKALTAQGLQKNGERHEKDDRQDKIGRDQYVLGWDNREKLLFIQKELKDLEEKIKMTNTKVFALKKEQEEIENNIRNLQDLLLFTNFQKINWQKEAEKIIELESKITKLESANQHLKELQAQLKEVEKKWTEKNNQRQQEAKNEGVLEEKTTELENKKSNIKSLLSNYEHIELDEKSHLLNNYLSSFDHRIELNLIDNKEKEIREIVEKDIEKKQNHIKTKNDELVTLMNKYKRPGQEIAQKFLGWEAETINLEANTEQVCLTEYEDLYKIIKGEELEQHQEKFNKRLNEEMIKAMTSYRESFNKHEEEILENIENINQSLKKIVYTRQYGTYIAIENKKTTNRKIQDFKEMLNTWQPNQSRLQVSTKEERNEILAACFEKIKIIITKLNEDETWRKEVSDVRNWFDFIAKEYFREDKKLFKTHENTATNSGGEAARLTYTILCSAIAYQFGITQGNRKSLRFIAVDEAFSKTDQDMSKYLMVLCQELGLQLMVITPLTNIHIAEPFISHCHYVEKKLGEKSIVHNLTKEKFMEKKREFEALAELEN